MNVTGFLLVMLALQGAPDEYHAQRYTAHSENAALYVLPNPGSGVPDVVVLDDSTLTVYRGNAQTPVLSHSIPADTLFFDLYDTNGDTTPELFVLTPNEVRHYPAHDNASTIQLFPIEPPLPWKVDQPFLHTLLFHFNDIHLVAVPYQDTIELKSMDGKTISAFPKLLSDVHSLYSIPIEPNQLGPDGAFEFRVDTLLTTPINVPMELRPTLPSKPFATATPQQLRDSELLELELWPSFPLTRTGEAPNKVIYASESPEHIHTVIRIKKKLPRNIPNTTEAYRFSPKRTYPGMIGISASGLPDFNGDGYHDLLLWKIPIPGNSISTIMKSVQAQTWPIEITTHLYNPQKGLYDARPSSRIKTTVALQYILTRQSHSPLHNLSFVDLNADGKSDITFSPTAQSIATWIYSDQMDSIPVYQGRFEDPVSLITLNRAEVSDTGQSILLRGNRSIYRINLSERAPG